MGGVKLKPLDIMHFLSAKQSDKTLPLGAIWNFIHHCNAQNPMKCQTNLSQKF